MRYDVHDIHFGNGSHSELKVDISLYDFILMDETNFCSGV